MTHPQSPPAATNTPTAAAAPTPTTPAPTTPTPAAQQGSFIPNDTADSALYQRVQNLEENLAAIALLALDISRVAYAYAKTQNDAEGMDRLKRSGLQLKEFISLIPSSF